MIKVRYTSCMSLELTIMHEIQRWFSHPWGQIFVVICARWCIFVLPLVVLVAWRWGSLSRHALVEIMWSTLLASILVFGAEIIIGRTRPFLLDPSLAVLVPRPHTMSFPSAHASIAYALAFMTLHWSTRVGIGTVLLADLVALAIFLKLFLVVPVVWVALAAGSSKTNNSNRRKALRTAC